MHALPDQNPGHTLNPAKASRQHRIIFLALGGAAALALFLARRGSSAGPAPASVQGNTTDPTNGSTFADNGGQAAQLGSDVTGALADQATALQGLAGALGGLPDQVAASTAAAVATTQQPPSDVTGTATPADPAGATPVVINLNAAPAGSPAGKANPATIIRPSAAHGGAAWTYRTGSSGRLIPVAAAPKKTTVKKPAAKKAPAKKAPAKKAPAKTLNRTPPKKKGAAAGKR